MDSSRCSARPSYCRGIADTSTLRDISALAGDREVAGRPSAAPSGGGVGSVPRRRSARPANHVSLWTPSHGAPRIVPSSSARTRRSSRSRSLRRMRIRRGASSCPASVRSAAPTRGTTAAAADSPPQSELDRHGGRSPSLVRALRGGVPSGCDRRAGRPEAQRGSRACRRRPAVRVPVPSPNAPDTRRSRSPRRPTPCAGRSRGAGGPSARECMVRRHHRPTRHERLGHASRRDWWCGYRPRDEPLEGSRLDPVGRPRPNAPTTSRRWAPPCGVRRDHRRERGARRRAGVPVGRPASSPGPAASARAAIPGEVHVRACRTPCGRVRRPRDRPAADEWAPTS